METRELEQGSVVKHSFSDLELLSLLNTKELFSKVTPYIKDYVLTPEALNVLKNIDLYYKENPAAVGFDWGSFKHFMLTTHNGHFKKAETELYAALIDRLNSREFDASIADDLLTFYITKDYGTKIGNMADTILRGDEEYTLDDVEQLVLNYRKDVGAAITSKDLFECPTESVGASRAAPGLEWRLEELNVSLGPLRPGDFVVVAARPETGKTTFIADNVTYMATQDKTDRPIVWVRNEEGASRINDRVRQAALGLTQVQIELLGTKVNGEYTKIIPARKILVLKDDAGVNTTAKLDRIFEELDPMLIVFDVLDKVGMSGKYDRDDLRLGALYKWARDTAIKRCPVIATSQVSGGAEGVKWITQELLRGSQTDKAGEADAIITIGKENTPSMELQRFVHIAKNKLTGGLRSQEIYRHGYFEVEIQPQIARYKGTM